MTSNLAVRPEALPAWHALGGTLNRLRSERRPVPCWSDPQPFTSEDRHDRAEAATACTRCPALAACRLFAETNPEPAHVWAGEDRTPSTRADRKAVA